MSKTEAPGCLGFLFPFLRPAAPPALPYRLRDEFLSAAELSFYRVLRGAVGERWVIFAKVRLADLFYVARPHENPGARNSIAQKHVDFVLCDSQTLQPVAGVELDDSSHKRADRAERDEKVDSYFQAAGLPLVHIKAARGYNPADLLGQIQGAIGRA